MSVTSTGSPLNAALPQEPTPGPISRPFSASQ